MARSDGLCALFASRRDADLAIEHLVQEHGIERDVLFVEAAGTAASTGTRVGGADGAGAAPGTAARDDAPLGVEIQLTVPVTNDDRPVIEGALREAGARQIRRIA